MKKKEKKRRFGSIILVISFVLTLICPANSIEAGISLPTENTTLANNLFSEMTELLWSQWMIRTSGLSLIQSSSCLE